MAPKKEKPYCAGDCRLDFDKFRCLVTEPLTKLGEQLWVHICNKPSLGVWERYIDTCEECFSEFSSPWETICYKCWKRGAIGALPRGPFYLGWVASRSRLSRATTGRTAGLMGDILESEPSQGLNFPESSLPDQSETKSRGRKQFLDTM